MEQPQAPVTPPPIVNPTPPPVVAPAPTAPAPAAPAPQVVVVQAKSTPVWAWLLGGCLGIILLTMITIAGLTWWGIQKAKEAVKEVQPNLEQWKEKADKMSAEADRWQEESEKIRSQIPEMPVE